MTSDEIRRAVLSTLSSIAPEADLARLKPATSIREQLDVDSMDFLNFVIALHQQFDLEIPERDYPKLMTVDGCVEYLNSASQQRKTEA